MSSHRGVHKERTDLVEEGRYTIVRNQHQVFTIWRLFIKSFKGALHKNTLFSISSYKRTTKDTKQLLTHT